MKIFFKFIRNSKLKQIFILLLLFSVYIFVSAYSYVSSVSTDISSSVFRLHVIANSDSKEDQDLKYLVRDNLITYMNSICKDTTSKDEAISIANNHKEEFYTIAKNVLVENGANYDVKISIGNFSFPTKNYGDIFLPSGYYDALRVELGNAKGKNWWCVMFPPLCFVDVSSGIVPDDSKEVIKDNLSQEEYDLISDKSNAEITFKFKLIEFFQNANLFTAKK